jgi:uncharacterized protein (DUF427 family)
MLFCQQHGCAKLIMLLSVDLVNEETHIMAKAVWNGKVIAESDATIVVEGNHYFPPDAVNAAYLSSSQHHTICPWKGEASYYNINVDGQVNRNAAWYYPTPSQAAGQIKDYVAFWHGVTVED